MPKQMLFSAIADFYEYSVTHNCEYDRWASYVESVIKKYVGKSGKGIDAACGSGFYTRALKRAGYSVCGVDISDEMLTSAIGLAAKERLAIDFRKEDMTKLKSFEKVDFITVINDGINFIPRDKLVKTLKSFNACLKKGGLLHFDISSEYKLKNVIGNQTFCEDEDDYSYIWFNTLSDDKVEMNLSVFLKRGELYCKKECCSVEYIYTFDEIKNALDECGFKLVAVDAQYGELLKANSERICFSAIKK